MDDSLISLWIGLIASVFLLTLVSIIQNTFNLLSSVRLQNLAAAGQKQAQVILDALENQNRVFLTLKILKTILITIIVLGLNEILHQWNPIWIILIALTLIVIITEVFALSVSRVNPDRTITRLSWLVSLFLTLMSPFYFISDIFLKIFSLFLKPEVDNIITEQELLNIIDEAQSEGGLQEAEGELIRRSIEFNDLIAEEILTPRVDLIALDINWSQEKIESIIDENEYSRYPVYQDTIDSIIGVVHTKDFKKLKDNFDLNEILSPVIFVPESYKIFKLLKQIQQNNSHLAVIIDEHGGTAGIVTLEDIVEELVGEIWDEHDDEEREITQVNYHQTIVLASVELYKVEEALEVDLESDESDASTIGGWIIEQMGKIPEAQEELITHGLHITILEADEKRVIKVLIDNQKGELDDEQTDQAE